jgi:hypothetical protein
MEICMTVTMDVQYCPMSDALREFVPFTFFRYLLSVRANLLSLRKSLLGLRTNLPSLRKSLLGLRTNLPSLRKSLLGLRTNLLSLRTCKFQKICNRFNINS